jgi:hypothetical protein
VFDMVAKPFGFPQASINLLEQCAQVISTSVGHHSLGN